MKETDKIGIVNINRLNEKEIEKSAPITSKKKR